MCEGKEAGAEQTRADVACQSQPADSGPLPFNTGQRSIHAYRQAGTPAPTHLLVHNLPGPVAPPLQALQNQAGACEVDLPPGGELCVTLPAEVGQSGALEDEIPAGRRRGGWVCGRLGGAETGSREGRLVRQAVGSSRASVMAK